MLGVLEFRVYNSIGGHDIEVVQHAPRTRLPRTRLPNSRRPRLHSLGFRVSLLGFRIGASRCRSGQERLHSITVKRAS